MGKRIRKLVNIFLLVVVGLLVVRSFLKYIYFPNNPTTFSIYRIRTDYDPKLNGNQLEMLDPPLGGCFDICYGDTSTINCQKYSRKYDYCEVSCSGYLFNNCSSPGWGIIVGILTR